MKEPGVHIAGLYPLDNGAQLDGDGDLIHFLGHCDRMLVQIRDRLQLGDRGELDELEYKGADRRDTRIEVEGESCGDGNVRRDSDPEEAEDRGEGIGDIEEADRKAEAPATWQLQ